ncbi:MAG: glycerophosphodiester phosphodiesterase [Ardenticatenales bacterium]|nr:glycerophosphodiester phosphodiesterase [Ardenticatenales bacterium]
MELLRSTSGKILVEAHRGASTLAPENSWAALLAAQEGGADIIEVDVQITADEVPILYHPYRLPGGSLLRAAPSSAIAGLDAGDGRPPPRLDEVLAWGKEHGVLLALDVKNGFGQGVLPFARVLQMVVQAGMVEQVMMAALDHMGLLWAKRHEPALTTRAVLRGNPLDLVAMAQRTEVDALGLSYDLIDRSDVEALHEVGIAVMIGRLWEPNFRYPVDLGVDIISWSDPAEAIFALAQQGAHEQR